MEKLINLDRRSAIIAAAIGIAVLIVYIPAMGGGFSWDEQSIFANGASERYVEFMESNFTRPMHNALFGFERALWGDAGWPYHVLNILLHLMNAFAVYILCVKLTANRRAGAIAAALFALAPGCTEAVSWIWGRAELLKTLFFNVAFISYIEYRREAQWQALGSSALFFLLALMSGQGALALIAVIAVFDFSLEGRPGRKRLLWAALSYALAIACYMLLLPGRGEFFPWHSPGSARLLEALSALGYYTIKLVMPIGQSPLPEMQSAAYLAMVSMAIPVITALLFWDGRRMSGMLWLICFLAIVPAVFIVLQGFRYPLGFRYLYMPISALAILAGLALDRISNRQAFIAAVAIVCITLAGFSLMRTVLWARPAELWADAAAKSKRLSGAKVNHAAALLDAGRNAEARASAARSFSSVDMNFTEFHRASRAYLGANGYDDDQAYIDIVSTASNPAKAYYGLGYVYYNEFARQKKDSRTLDKARDYLLRAADLAPDMAGINYHLGLIYLQTEEVEKAEHYFSFANTVNPDGLFVQDIKYFLDAIGRIRASGLIPPKAQSVAH